MLCKEAAEKSAAVRREVKVTVEGYTALIQRDNPNTVVR